jgi:hypothetical protein
MVSTEIGEPATGTTNPDRSERDGDLYRDG